MSFTQIVLQTDALEEKLICGLIRHNPALYYSFTCETVQDAIQIAAFAERKNNRPGEEAARELSEKLTWKAMCSVNLLAKGLL